MNPRVKTRREDTPLFDRLDAKPRKQISLPEARSMAFDTLRQSEAERARDLGTANTLANAEARGDWPDQFLAAVEKHARSNATFLAEDVLAICPAPFGVNAKAVGPLMKRAQNEGYCKACGVGRANSSNRSFKVLWASKLYGGGG